MSAPPTNPNGSAAAAAAAIAASLAPGGGNANTAKRRFADPEYIAISEFLSSVEVEDQDANHHHSHSNTGSSGNGANANGRGAVGDEGNQLARSGASSGQQKRARLAAAGGSAQPPAPRRAAPLAAGKAYQEGDSRELVVANKSRAGNGAVRRDGAGELPLSDPRGRAVVAYSGTRDALAELPLQRLDVDFGGTNQPEDDEFDDNQSDRSSGNERQSAASRHTKLTDLEARVRSLERDNLHLKQTLLLGKNGSVMIAGRGSRENTQRLLSERTKVVTEMVEQLNASFLTIGDAARVWHDECRIGVGVREWDAFGQLQTISLWNMIRSVFATIAVDIVELRPHLPDGEMILTKWRIQGEIASPAQLESVCSSEDCPPTMKVALMAIKSSDLTFTVTTYVIFQDALIAEQHHCWDQVGVFKRLFGGEIPRSVQNILTIT
ncbi:hypothetical protein Gpo141_00002652 [Globisporangium polare]